MKYFHGVVDVASQGSLAVKGLKELGEDAALGVWRGNIYSSIKADYDLDIQLKNPLEYPGAALKMLDLYRFARDNFDVFHFHASRSLLPKNWDLTSLDKLGKKYFFEYHGSELRQGSVFTENNPYAHLIPVYQSQPQYLKRAVRQLENAAGTIVHDEEIRQFLPSNASNIWTVPLKMDLEANSYVGLSNKPHGKLKVVHAPTNRAVKGSDYIIKACENLQDDFDFELVLVEGKTLDEAREIYKQADIIIDQLLIGTYGVFALECMAMGKPVVCYVRDDLLSSFPPELPVVNANIDTIESVLRDLLSSQKVREEAGNDGRGYVQRYHDYRVIVPFLLRIYSGEIQPLNSAEGFQFVSDLSKKGR